MSDIALSEAQQRALRSLVATEPVPGSPLPDRRLLEQVVVLIPCSAIGVAITDAAGHLLDVVDLPPSLSGVADRHGLDGPVPLGIQWAARGVAHHDGHGCGFTDTLTLGYRNGADLLVRLEMARRGKPFVLRDIAVLHLLEPVFQRVFRERLCPHLPADLTVQERRVLQLVAMGRSNAQIAERMGIAQSTVRKHLEHAFPKLGVSNRFAAAIAFEGRVPAAAGRTPPPLERFA